VHVLDLRTGIVSCAGNLILSWVCSVARSVCRPTGDEELICHLSTCLAFSGDIRSAAAADLSPIHPCVTPQSGLRVQTNACVGQGGQAVTQAAQLCGSVHFTVCSLSSLCNTVHPMTQPVQKCPKCVIQMRAHYLSQLQSG
jgi:hypothetical protein